MRGVLDILDVVLFVKFVVVSGGLIVLMFNQTI